MGLEGIKNSGMSYQTQGSSLSQSTKPAAVEASAGSDTAGTATSQMAEPVITESARGEEANKDNNKGQASNESIKRAVDEINKHANGSEAIFGIHEATNRVTIKIVDKKTREVIKEFPAEETLDMIAKVWEMAGMMVDEKR